MLTYLLYRYLDQEAFQGSEKNFVLFISLHCFFIFMNTLMASGFVTKQLPYQADWLSLQSKPKLWCPFL